MKFLIVFVCVCIAVAKGELDAEFRAKAMEKIQEVGAECVVQENANSDDVRELLEKHMPTRNEGKCVMACFNEHFGIQDESGKLVMDQAKKAIEPFVEADIDIHDKMIQVIEKCFPEVGDTGDRCENAVQMAVCAKKFGEEIGLLDDILM